MTPLNADEGQFALTLDGLNPQTIYFSDRPERVFGLATTATFLEGLGFTPEDPPNAALVVTTENGEEDVLILELLEPVWDEASGTLTYTVQLLSDYAEPGLAFAALQQTDFDLPENFGLGGLFIDGCSTDRVFALCIMRMGPKARASAPASKPRSASIPRAKSAPPAPPPPSSARSPTRNSASPPGGSSSVEALPSTKRALRTWLFPTL